MNETLEKFHHRFLRNFEPPTSFKQFETLVLPKIDETKRSILISSYVTDFNNDAPDNIKILASFMKILIESTFDDIAALKKIGYRFNFTRETPDIWVEAAHVTDCTVNELHHIMRLLNSWQAISSFLHASTSFEYPEFIFLVNCLSSEMINNYDDYAYNPSVDEIDNLTNIAVLLTTLNQK